MLLWLPQDASIKLQNIHQMSRRKAKLEAKESRGRETSSDPGGMEKSHLATTGNWIFAECVEVCRVAKNGHSAKRHFAERQTQHSAKNQNPVVHYTI